MTSLSAAEIAARTLYEQVYCARGEVENRIKEQQLDLFADRLAARTGLGPRSPTRRPSGGDHGRQSAPALVRVLRLRLDRGAQADRARFTQFANATCGTIRLKLLKIGAQVRVSVRRIKVAMASACPFQTEYHLKRAAAF